MSYETRCVKIKLKPNSVEKVREWALTINERKAEALATLRDESVISETVYLDQSETGGFLIYLMKAESFAKARETVKNQFIRLKNFIKILNAKLGRAAKSLNFLLI